MDFGNTSLAILGSDIIALPLFMVCQCVAIITPAADLAFCKPKCYLEVPLVNGSSAGVKFLATGHRRS